MTTSIDIVTLLTIIYVLVDDWYKAEGHRLLKGKPGAKPVFTDSEVITLVLAECKVEYADLDAALADWTESRAEVGIFRALAEATVHPRSSAGRAKAGEARRRRRRTTR